MFSMFLRDEVGSNFVDLKTGGFCPTVKISNSNSNEVRLHCIQHCLEEVEECRMRMHAACTVSIENLWISHCNGLDDFPVAQPPTKMVQISLHLDGEHNIVVVYDLGITASFAGHLTGVFEGRASQGTLSGDKLWRE